MKYQLVAIDALTGADDEKAFVDHTDTSIDGTSDGYALFVEEENEFLRNQLADTDEAAIELFETSVALEEANDEQDEAIIEIYESKSMK